MVVVVVAEYFEEAFEGGGDEPIRYMAEAVQMDVHSRVGTASSTIRWRIAELELWLGNFQKRETKIKLVVYLSA